MTNVPDLAERAGYLISLAARAPSVHNTQPWRFEVSERAIELYADASRQLLEDPAGREMLISCGAALYGLRLGIRSLGYRTEVELFPGPALLVTSVDHQEEGRRAGRGLQRLLLRAASHWVFASLQTQPLQVTSVRALI